MTANTIMIVLIIAIILMLLIRNRLQKKAALSQGNICYWSVDHWVTSTPILLSRLNELTNIDLNKDDQLLTLQDWLSNKLNRPIRSSDVVYHDDMTFLVLRYDSSAYNQVYIYPAN